MSVRTKTPRALTARCAMSLVMLVACRDSPSDAVPQQQRPQTPSMPIPARTAPGEEAKSTSAGGQQASAPLEPPSAAPQVNVPAGSVEVAGKVISVDAFAIDRTEVTVDAYASCVGARECTPPASDEGCNWQHRKAKRNYPINCVTVKQAQNYCERHGQHLPTAAEWQLAAGGPERRPYPWGDVAPSNIAVAEPVQGKYTPGRARHHLCWEGDNTDKDKYPIGTCPVGSYPVGNTPSGIADMAGNVAEWTATSVRQPHGAVEYVIKGGGYAFDGLGPPEVGVDDSSSFDDAHQAPDIGFRCATAGAAR